MPDRDAPVAPDRVAPVAPDREAPVAPDREAPVAPDREAYVEAVLSLVERVPVGRVTTYGLVAEAVGRGGARGVGRVMALYGAPVPWWRVVRADGSLPDSHRREALPRYREEGTPLRESRRESTSLRVDLRTCLWDPVAEAGA